MELFLNLIYIVDLIGVIVMWLYYIFKEKYIVVFYYVRGSLFLIIIEVFNFFFYESLNL